MAELTERIMIVCELCGDKRCPHAEDCLSKCTGNKRPASTSERQRAIEIVQAEYEYWANVETSDDFGNGLTMGATGAAANILAAIGLGWSLDEVRRRIAERDGGAVKEANAS